MVKAKRFYKTGCIAGVSTFDNGVQDGIMRAWHENGHKGVDLLWHENGRRMRKIKFKDGLERVWLEDGTLGRKTRYKDGLVQSNLLVGLGWVGLSCRSPAWIFGLTIVESTITHN